MIFLCSKSNDRREDSTLGQIELSLFRMPIVTIVVVVVVVVVVIFL